MDSPLQLEIEDWDQQVRLMVSPQKKKTNSKDCPWMGAQYLRSYFRCYFRERHCDGYGAFLCNITGRSIDRLPSRDLCDESKKQMRCRPCPKIGLMYHPTGWPCRWARRYGLTNHVLEHIRSSQRKIAWCGPWDTEASQRITDETRRIYYY